MKDILKKIAEETSGQSFETYKFCYDEYTFPRINYDDQEDFKLKKYGETERIKKTKPLYEKASTYKKYKPLFRFFLDGSRRAYKVDDVAYGNRVYPIIAGQIGVACCERNDKKDLSKKIIENNLVLALPECADKDGIGTVFFNNLKDIINSISKLKKMNIQFSEILSYEDRELSDGETYENLGIAKVQDKMMDDEKKIVSELATQNSLSESEYLLKDGSLEYKTMKTGNYRDLSIIKSNYKCVVGVSKSFNPEKCIDEKGLSNAKKIAQLSPYSRTPAYIYEPRVTPDVSFAIWYLRIRDMKYTTSPFEGIVKIEKILITDEEKERGLNSEEIDLISANIINERNPVCYCRDKRWANHLYPVFLTETYIKSHYYSNAFFMNLF